MYTILNTYSILISAPSTYKMILQKKMISAKIANCNHTRCKETSTSPANSIYKICSNDKQNNKVIFMFTLYTTHLTTQYYPNEEEEIYCLNPFAINRKIPVFPALTNRYRQSQVHGRHFGLLPNIHCSLATFVPWLPK